jgi:hypothetical protein
MEWEKIRESVVMKFNNAKFVVKEHGFRTVKKRDARATQLAEN